MPPPSPPPPTSLDDILDLLIIGAGPIGLCSALGAFQRGARKILIAEQARGLGETGRMTDLLPNAITALRVIHPSIYEKIRPYLFKTDAQATKFRSVNIHGELLQQLDIDDWEVGMMRWWHIQQTLISLLPSENVLLLNHQMVDLAQHESGEYVEAEFVLDRQQANLFKNWQDAEAPPDDHRKPDSILNTAGLRYSLTLKQLSEQYTDARRTKLKARLVIGADGINSTVRRCLYRDRHPDLEHLALAEYTGLVRLGAFGSVDISAEDEDTLREKYVGTSLTCSITCDKEDVTYESIRAIISRPVARERGNWSWKCVFYAAFDEDELAAMSQVEVRERIHDMARKAGFPREIVGLSERLWSGSGGRDKSVLPMYIVPVESPVGYERLATAGLRGEPEGFDRIWYDGRVCLVGDALHGSPPFLAQGNAMGMEDVAELMEGLGRWDWRSGGVGELQGLLKEWKKKRVGRIALVHKLSVNRTSEYEGEEMRKCQRILWGYGIKPW